MNIECSGLNMKGEEIEKKTINYILFRQANKEADRPMELIIEIMDNDESKVVIQNDTNDFKHEVDRNNNTIKFTYTDYPFERMMSRAKSEVERSFYSKQLENHKNKIKKTKKEKKKEAEELPITIKEEQSKLYLSVILHFEKPGDLEKFYNNFKKDDWNPVQSGLDPKAYW